MDPSGDPYGYLVSHFAGVLAPINATGEMHIAEIAMIDIGRHSKNTEEFAASFKSGTGLELPDHLAPALLNTIHQFFPPRTGQDFSIELVEEEAPLLREENREQRSKPQAHRSLSDFVKPARERVKKGVKRPIENFEADIVQALSENSTLIIVDQTGSDETTWIPHRLPNFYRRRCEIVSTYLCRKVERIANMSIEYMEEFRLCNMIIADPSLLKFSAIIINGAHERSITTDALLGLVKNVVKNRYDMRRGGFRLIITLGTWDEADRLASYFFGCDILFVQNDGREEFPDKIIFQKSPIRDPLESALQLVWDHLTGEPLGDILLFVSSPKEVDHAIRVLSKRAENLNQAFPCPLFVPACSSWRCEIDPRVFEKTPTHTVKVVVATTAAEASLMMLDGIIHVIDLGLTERRTIHARQVIDTPVLTWISKASAGRRALIAGKTSAKDGICNRLYTKEEYQIRISSVTIPDIQIANLGAAVLRLIASWVIDVASFEFLYRPPPQRVDAALRKLYYLGALDENGFLTNLGRNMSLFPLAPPWSKALVYGGIFGCREEVLTVVAMVSAEVDPSHEESFEAEGDHLRLLAVYEDWEANRNSSEWRHCNSAHYESLRRANMLRNLLAEIMNSYQVWNIESHGRTATSITKAITSGLFFHAARRDLQSEECYRTLVGNHRVYIHPQSAVFRRRPSWVIYNKLAIMADGVEYMFGVMAIDPNWLIELAPRFFREENMALRFMRRFQ